MTNNINFSMLLSLIILFASCNKEPFELQTQSNCSLDFTEHEHHAKYQEILDQFSQNGVVGLSVIIDKNGDGIWNGSSGYSSVEENIKMNNCNLYQTASLVKSFVGISILQLIDEGLLTVDSKINDFLPDEISSNIPNSENLTIEHLLHHTSGLPDIFDLEFITDFMNDPNKTYTRKELLAYISGRAVLDTPGQTHFYSDANSMLLSFVIDNVKGDFIDYMHSNIFEPLNMSDTYYHNGTYPEIDGLPQSYWEQYNDGNIENISQVQKLVTSYIKGSDGIISSPKDMVSFYKSVFEGDLISETLKQSIITDQVEEPIEFKMHTGYAHGFMSIEDNGQTWIGHVGSQLGNSCYVFYNIDTKDCIGVFTNTGTFLFQEKQQLIYRELWEALKGVI